MKKSANSPKDHFEHLTALITGEVEEQSNQTARTITLNQYLPGTVSTQHAPLQTWDFTGLRRHADITHLLFMPSYQGEVLDSEGNPVRAIQWGQPWELAAETWPNMSMLSDSATTADAVTSVTDISQKIVTALVAAYAATQNTDLDEDDKSEHLAQQVAAVIDTHGPPAVKPTLRFLVEEGRSLYCRDSIVHLSEKLLSAKYEDFLLDGLMSLIGGGSTTAKYAAATALGRRKGQKAFSRLQQALLLVKKDPMLNAMVKDYLSARGADGEAVSQAN